MRSTQKKQKKDKKVLMLHDKRSIELIQKSSVVKFADLRKKDSICGDSLNKISVNLSLLLFSFISRQQEEKSGIDKIDFFIKKLYRSLKELHENPDFTGKEHVKDCKLVLLILTPFLNILNELNLNAAEFSDEEKPLVEGYNKLKRYVFDFIEGMEQFVEYDGKESLSYCINKISEYRDMKDEEKEVWNDFKYTDTEIWEV